MYQGNRLAVLEDWIDFTVWKIGLVVSDRMY